MSDEITMSSKLPLRSQPFIRISSGERLTTTGEPNGRPLPKPYVWHGDTAEAEQARAEADAAFIADARRRVRERYEAGLPPEFDVPFSDPEVPGDAPVISDLARLRDRRALIAPRSAWCTTCRHHYQTRGLTCRCACHQDLPAGAGSDPPVTTAPCAADGIPVKGDSRPADVPGPVPAYGTGDTGPGTALNLRCESCGYHLFSRGHAVTCGGE